MRRQARSVRASELADEFGRTAKLLGGRMTERLSEHGLSMPRFQLLVTLIRHGPMRLSELGSHVGISQGTTSTLVGSLVRDGLIERASDPTDRRAITIAVTAAGRARGEVWRRDYERAAEVVFAVLPVDGWPVLQAALRALAGQGGPPTSQRSRFTRSGAATPSRSGQDAKQRR